MQCDDYKIVIKAGNARLSNTIAILEVAIVAVGTNEKAGTMVHRCNDKVNLLNILSYFGQDEDMYL